MGAGIRFGGGGRSGRGMIGQVFDRLTVVGDSGLRDNSGAIKWECLCSCGNTTYARGISLKRGEYRSCGCWTKDRMESDPPAKTHGGSSSVAYRTWAAMLKRCRDTEDKH